MRELKGAAKILASQRTLNMYRNKGITVYVHIDKRVETS